MPKNKATKNLWYQGYISKKHSFNSMNIPNRYWELIKGSETLKFRTYSELVNYMSRDNQRFGNEVSNNYINRIGVNDNDVIKVREFKRDIFGNFTSVTNEIQRCYRVQTPYGAYFWNNTMRDDILKNKFNEKAFDNWYYWHRKLNKPKIRGRWAKYYYINYPGFRDGPWPGIRSHHRYNHVYRQISVMNEKRQACDPEYKDYFRGTRGKNLPDSWDTEPTRDWRNRGWKKQGRKSRQWERNPKKARGVWVDNTYNKRATIEVDLDELESEICG